MEYEQWQKILGEINLENDLNFNNVVEKIQEKLAVEDKDECEKWKNTSYNLNYLFSVCHSSRNTVHKETLFCLATHNYLHKVKHALLQRAFNMGPTSEMPVHNKIDGTTKPSSNMEVVALGESSETLTKF